MGLIYDITDGTTSDRVRLPETPRREDGYGYGNGARARCINNDAEPVLVADGDPKGPGTWTDTEIPSGHER